MDFETWHYLVLLRPLFVFVLASPLIVAAVFAGRSKDKRDEKRVQAPELERKAAHDEHRVNRGYEVTRSALHNVNEWEIRRLTEINAQGDPRRRFIAGIERFRWIFTRSLHRNDVHFTKS
jgi:hypothetical protein